MGVGALGPGGADGCPRAVPLQGRASRAPVASDGGRRARRSARVATDDAPWVEPSLGQALNDLTGQQRTCTVLVHCYGWTRPRWPQLLELSKSSVQTHVDRGLDRLRTELAVDRDG